MQVYSFNGSSVINSNLTSADTTFEFTPHVELMGQVAYVKCTAFNWRYQNTPASLTASDTFILSMSLTQPVSGNVTSQGTKQGNCVLATIQSGKVYSCGPVLCAMPAGTTNVVFTVTRADGGLVANSLTARLFVVLEIAKYYRLLK